MRNLLIIILAATVGAAAMMVYFVVTRDHDRARPAAVETAEVLPETPLAADEDGAALDPSATPEQAARAAAARAAGQPPSALARTDAPLDDKPVGEAPSSPIEPAVTAAMDDEQLAANLCRASSIMDALPSSGTLFGHKRYNNADPGDLAAPPAGIAGGNCGQINAGAARALTELLAAARADDPAVARAMRGISCYRSIQRQVGLYCAASRIATRGYRGQARWVAPPGFSEHSTGYAIDFGDRSNSGCDLSPCFRSTIVGRWLRENASRFGFELSFPEGNAQGVSHEPWHYRWVGDASARARFAR